jgi:hypothetical protein
MTVALFDKDILEVPGVQNCNYFLKVCHPRCVVNNYTTVRTVNEHNEYGMVLQMYLTIHKYNIATNVIYSNNDYM